MTEPRGVLGSMEVDCDLHNMIIKKSRLLVAGYSFGQDGRLSVIILNQEPGLSGNRLERES